ncbi:hypothetical protein L2E82_33277 [Cichorium intybus]|uniref:Uncharacterized protein n=1 Tax=Cichorium intybus TaxID=13427 RepID=A0ACB9BJP8_CICIN|nr:hypothetical protein L2E82_33277 [Cichorium intybus]
MVSMMRIRKLEPSPPIFAALAEAAAPYGIESFDSVLKPLWKGIRSHHGKVLAAFLKAIGFIIPLMDAIYASYYPKEVMVILIREFQSPDEEMKKIVLKVVKQCVSTEGVEADYIRSDILLELLGQTYGFGPQKLPTACRHNSRKSKSQTKLVSEELLIDGILYAFQEQTSDGANVMLNGFGVVVNAPRSTSQTLPPSNMWYHKMASKQQKHESSTTSCRFDFENRDCDETMPRRTIHGTSRTRVIRSDSQHIRLHRKSNRPARRISNFTKQSESPRKTNRVCTTVAIAIVAETCLPFTVLPALINEYRVLEPNVQNGVLKSLSFLFEYIGEMGKDYIYAVTPLLEDAMMDRDLLHRQTAASAVKHMALGVAGLGCEDVLVHLLNYVWPNVFETSPHVINAVMEAIEGMRVADALVAAYPVLEDEGENVYSRPKLIMYHTRSMQELKKVNIDAPVLKDCVHEFATLDMLLRTPEAHACADDISIWVKKYISIRGHEFSY